ncbi:MAG: hypothetical protein P4M09_11045 [Devosia sp.]|nr:hypothetical protein [Devosia sp.]
MAVQFRRPDLVQAAANALAELPYDDFMKIAEELAAEIATDTNAVAAAMSGVVGQFLKLEGEK